MRKNRIRFKDVAKGAKNALKILYKIFLFLVITLRFFSNNNTLNYSYFAPLFSDEMNQSIFEDEKGRFTDHYFLKITPTYDTTSKLEFNIPPAGAFIQLQNSVLEFETLIPVEFVVENSFCQKLIEFIEFKLWF